GVECGMQRGVDADLPVTVGLVTWVAGNLYVTDAGTDHSIQRGVDAATAGNTVNVEAGTYTGELVQVTKTLTLLGAQHGVDARTRAVPGAHEAVGANGDGVFQGPADQGGSHGVNLPRA